MRRCPICGRKVKTGILCEICSQEKEDLGLGFKEIKVKVCSRCGRYFYNNKWIRYDLIKHVLKKIAKEKIKNPRDIPLTITPIVPRIKFNPGMKYDVEIEIIAKYQEFLIPARISVALCPKCGKAGTQYYEGILQLRDAELDLKPVLDFVYEETRKQKQIDKGAFVTKEKKVRGGYDLYFTSKRFMRTLAQKLKTNFKGDLKVSPTLFSRDKLTSKAIYRVNIMFRLRKYNVGDIIEYDDRKVRIKSVGKRTIGVDIRTGEKISID